MSEPTTVTYTVTADQTTHANLTRLLRTANILGKWGCSRTIGMPFDGDGSAFLHALGLDDVPFDKAALESQTDRKDRLVNVCACGMIPPPLQYVPEKTG